MARQNIVFMYARVNKSPIIAKTKDTDEFNYGMVYVETVRGVREVDDKVKYVRHDYPLIISREKHILEDIATWEENDIVIVKGAITSKKIVKTSHCPNCTTDGVATKNKSEGNLLYITPIYVKKVKSFDTKEEAIEEIIQNREISNQAYVVGTLLKDPKLFKTKTGVRITQYPIAINRKFTIRTDDPTIRTDYPMVKSYGEQAINDKTFLKYQAEVIIDGFLQARTVTRKQKCACCGEYYEWKDNSLELVPYEVEYLKGHLTPEEVEAERKQKVEEYKQMLYGNEDTVSDDEEFDYDTEDTVI